jgi:thiamine biosynthesis lipoprotein
VTVQPLWQLYAAAQKTGQLPDAAAIQQARRAVDWRNVEIAREGIRLKAPGTAVTLNGIAQGFAADRVVAVLRKHGIEHALVNTGEIGTVGGKPDGESWTVGVQHPRRAEAYAALANIAGRCMATSGDYATYFTPDHSAHHILDPATGRSPMQLASVTVLAPTGVEADALSTAIFVMGVGKGLALAQSTPGIDVLFAMKNGRTLATSGFRLAS